MWRRTLIMGFCLTVGIAAHSKADESFDRYKSILSDKDTAVILLKQHGKVYGCTVAKYIEGLHFIMTKTTGQDAAVEVEGLQDNGDISGKIKIGGASKNLFAVADSKSINVYLDKSSLQAATRSGMTISTLTVASRVMAQFDSIANDCMAKR